MSESLKLIETVEDLHYYLTQAMMIEHATLPPYLTALYSIKPETNLESFHIIRTIAVEEMLHLTLAANVYNAVGGDIKGVLTDHEFVPVYPTFLPTGETDFQVGIDKLSLDTVETFLKIERSHEVDDDAPVVGPRPYSGTLPHCRNWLKIRNRDDSLSYYSIGLFYAEIIRGMYELHAEMGDALFCGDAAKQVTSEYYYNGAGDIVKVTDIDSAVRAIQMIQEQGEGSRQGQIYDSERELCHYYRFEQLKLGQYYVVDQDNPLNSDKPGEPTGDKFTVDWDSIYPLLPNATVDQFPEGSELHTNAVEFHTTYSNFLAELETCFNGSPETLIPAVHQMFRIRELATQLIRNPIPGNEEFNGAPIFRIDQ